MKNQVQFIILLLFGLAFLVYLFPFIFVEAAKLQSGVTINAPSTTETEKICDDTIDNDNDGKIDAADQDCAAAPAGPTPGACKLQIDSGVPINYGQLNPGQNSNIKTVYVRNVEGTHVKIMVKGGDWISNVTGSPVSGPEITYVSMAGNTPFYALKSNEFQIGELGWFGPQARTTILYALKVPPSGFSGSLHQELSINCEKM
jgi:hypothetical protein